MPAKLIDERDDDRLALDLSECRGSEFHDTLAKIKDTPGSNFDWDRKLWLVPREAAVAERIMHSIQPTIENDLMDWIKAARTKEMQELTTKLPDDADLLIEWANHRAGHQPEFIKIGGEPYPFNGLLKHTRAVVDLAAEKRKLVIADDMGLAKTGTAISAVEEWRLRNRQEDGTLLNGPRLSVCPSSVKGTWVRELQLWLGKNAPLQVIDGTTKKARHSQLEQAIHDELWVIANWEQLRVKREKLKLKNGGTKTVYNMNEPLFEQAPWLAVIADEVHLAKNRKSLRTRGLWRVRADDGLMLALSGTPLMNTPDELWAILHWLWPKEYTSYWRFYEKYVDYYEGYFGKVITGVKNPDALRFELKERLVRRTQGQVLDLPGKGRIRDSLDLNKKQRKLYDKAEKDLWLEVEKAIEDGDESARKFAEGAVAGKSLYRLPNGAARTIRLRQIIETPANLGGDDDSAVLDSAVDHVMNSRPEQWAIFCAFKPTVKCLAERLRKHDLNIATYTGEVDPHERSRIEDEFQAGDLDVIVGTIDTMFQGITLTAGNRQYWCSRDWVPDKNEQGEDRQNRYGQVRRVMVFIAQPEETVAVDRVEPTNRLKERIVRAVLPKDQIEEETHA